MGVIKISLFQKRFSSPLSPALLKKLARQKTDFLLLPEYFYADSHPKKLAELTAHEKEALDWLQKQNEAYRHITIAGSVLHTQEGQRSVVAPILSEGQIVDYYYKQKLSTQEKKLAAAGEPAGAFILGGQRFAVLLGDEIYDSKLTRSLTDEAIKLVFSLSMVEDKTSQDPEEARQANEKRLVEIAKKHSFHIVRCCPVGSFLGKTYKGRSVVVTPDGVTWHISAEEEDKELLKTVVLNLRTL